MQNAFFSLFFFVNHSESFPNIFPLVRPKVSRPFHFFHFLIPRAEMVQVMYLLLLLLVQANVAVLSDHATASMRALPRHKHSKAMQQSERVAPLRGRGIDGRCSALHNTTNIRVSSRQCAATGTNRASEASQR